MLLTSPKDVSPTELGSYVGYDAGSPFNTPTQDAASGQSPIAFLIAHPNNMVQRWIELYEAMIQTEATTDGRPILSFPITYYRSIVSGPTNDGGTFLRFNLPWTDAKRTFPDFYQSQLRYRTENVLVQAIGHSRTIPALFWGDRRAVAPEAGDSPASPYLEAVRWIKQQTGLSQQRIAALVGVERQTLYLWERGNSMSDTNGRRILAVRDVLDRAARRYTSPERIRAWLDTPRDVDAQTPAKLLEAGEIDRARYLAVSTAADISRPSPSWTRKRVNQVFSGMRERRQVAFPLTNDATDPVAEVNDDK